MFLKAYRTETIEALLDGFMSAFAFFGGVPLSVLMDNTSANFPMVGVKSRRP